MSIGYIDPTQYLLNRSTLGGGHVVEEESVLYLRHGKRGNELGLEKKEKSPLLTLPHGARDGQDELLL
jgi:hypothetical protein